MRHNVRTLPVKAGPARSAPSRLYLAIALAIVGGSAHAQTVNAVANGQWDAAATWSNGSAPTAGNSYAVGSGFRVSSPVATLGNTYNFAFAGGALTIESGGTLFLPSTNGANNATVNYTIPNLTLEGGSIVTMSTGAGNTNRTLRSALNLSGSGSVTITNTKNTVSNNLSLSGELTGSTNILFAPITDGNSGYRKFIQVNSSDNPYEGNWTVSASGPEQGFLMANAAKALGTGNVTLTGATLVNKVANGLDSLTSVNVGTRSGIQVQADWSNPDVEVQLSAAATPLVPSVTITGTGTTMSIGNLTGVVNSTIIGNDADEALIVNTTADSSYAGNISNNGPTGRLSFTKNGDATQVLTGTNTYIGGTTINAGTLQLGNGGTTGSIAGDVTNNSRLSFNRSNAITFSGIISGSGAVSQLGTGTTVFTSDQTYTGGTTIGAGTLQLGDGGVTGNVTSNIVNNGELHINRSDTVTLPGVISGTGSVSQIGSGTTITAADNTYTGATTISAGTLQLGDGGTTGSVAGSITDNGTLAFHRADTVAYSNIISGAGGLTQLGPGSLQLGGAQTYTGPTVVQAGTLQVDGSIQSGTTTVAPGATLSGFGDLFGNVINRGTVWPGHAVAGDASYGTLTIHGSYVGDGGTLALNTYLGADGSPSDLLAIDGGTASGTTGVLVHNTAQATGVTRGSGILVVSALNGATTAPDAFNLLSEARAGALDYRLLRGGVNGTTPDSWYLRNEFVVEPDPSEPPDPSDPSEPPQPPDPPVPPDPPLPPDPPPSDPPPGVYPIIGPELATYGAVQPIARQLGLMTLGTMDQRIGDSAQMSSGDLSTDHGPSVWGRLLAQNIDNTYRAYAAPHAKGDLSGLQLGLDMWQGESLPGHHDRFGVYLAYGYADINIRGLVTNDQATNYVMQRTGSLTLRGKSGGAYWTHYGPGDWYVDGVLQATTYTGTARTGFANLDTEGVGFMGSLEFGYPFSLPQLGPGFVLEPQVQAVWQRVRFNERDDGLGGVSLGTTNGTSGRLGLRGKWQITTQSGRLWEPYVAANFWHDWGGRAGTVYGDSAAVPMLTDASRAELAGGITARLLSRLSIYGSVGYQVATGNTTNARRDSFNANAGLRYTW
jgi:outer membrane autotransporter protein